LLISYNLEEFKKDVSKFKDNNDYYKNRKTIIEPEYHNEFDKLLFDSDFTKILNPAARAIYTLNGKHPFKNCPSLYLDWDYPKDY